MGSAGKNNKKARGARKAAFRHRLAVLIALVLEKRLPEVFDGNMIVALGHPDFPRDDVFPFLDAAHGKGKLEERGSGRPRRFRLKLTVEDRLPEALQPFYDDVECWQEALQQFVSLEDAEHTLALEDIRLTFFTLSEDTVTLTDEQLEWFTSHYLAEELLQKAEGGRFQITAIARQRYLADTSADGAPPVDGPPADTPGPGAPADAPSADGADPAPSPPAAEPPEAVAGVSAHRLAQFKPLFLEVGFEVYPAKAEERYTVLGFPTFGAFNQAQGALREVGFLIRERKGQWRFNRNMVPASWVREREGAAPAPAPAAVGDPPIPAPEAASAAPPPAAPEEATPAAPPPAEPEALAYHEAGGGADGVTATHVALVASGTHLGFEDLVSVRPASPSPEESREASQGPPVLAAAPPFPAPLPVPDPMPALPPSAELPHGGNGVAEGHPLSEPPDLGPRVRRLEKIVEDLLGRHDAALELIADAIWRQFLQHLPPDDRALLLAKLEGRLRQR